MYSAKKPFWEISQNSREKTCVSLHPFCNVATPLHMFSVSFEIFFRTAFLQNTYYGPLSLNEIKQIIFFLTSIAIAALL